MRRRRRKSIGVFQYFVISQFKCTIHTTWTAWVIWFYYTSLYSPYNQSINQTINKKEKTVLAQTLKISTTKPAGSIIWPKNCWLSWISLKVLSGFTIARRLLTCFVEPTRNVAALISRWYFSGWCEKPPRCSGCHCSFCLGSHMHHVCLQCSGERQIFRTNILQTLNITLQVAYTGILSKSLIMFVSYKWVY